MPVRRGAGGGRLASGFGDLSDYIAGIAKMYGERALINDTRKQEQQFEEGKLLQNYLDGLSKLTNPEQRELATRGGRTMFPNVPESVWGSLAPTDAELTEPLVNKATTAKTPLDVPDIAAVEARLRALGRPSLTQGLGETENNAPPTLDSTQLGPGGSTFSPSAAKYKNPTEQTIADLIAKRRATLENEEQHDITLKGQQARATAAGSAQGELDVHSSPAFQTATQQTSEAQALGQNSSAVGAVKAANEKTLTPVLAARAGAEQHARSVAEYAVKYDPANVAKEAARAAEMSKATIEAGVLKQRAKNIEAAKENAVPLGAQLKRLSTLYAQAVQGNVPAMMAYHDLAQNLRPTIARATGYTGRITNVELNIAGNMIPSLVMDNLSGNALMKFKTLEGLAKYGAQVASTVPPDADINDYLSEVSRVVDTNMNSKESSVIAPGVPGNDLVPGAQTGPISGGRPLRITGDAAAGLAVPNGAPSPALRRLRGGQ